MRVNVDRVLERDQKLSELDDRAGICHRYLFIDCNAPYDRNSGYCYIYCIINNVLFFI